MKSWSRFSTFNMILAGLLLLVPLRAQQSDSTSGGTGSPASPSSSNASTVASASAKKPATAPTSDPKDIKSIATAQPPPPSKSPVQFRMGIPVWALGLSGEVGVKNVDSHINVDFDQIWRHLDGIVPLSADLRVEKFGFHIDGQWVKLGANLSPSGALLQSGSLELQQAFANFDLNYRLVDTDMFTVDPFIGGRFQYLSLSGTFESARPRLIPNVDASGDTEWVDPILGVEARMRVWKPLSIVFHGDVGGFGVASHLTDQLYGGVDLQITRCFFMDAGYRYIHTNYTSGGAAYKVDMKGPQLMFGFNF